MAEENTVSIYTPPAEQPYPGPHSVTEKIASLVLTPHTPIETPRSATFEMPNHANDMLE